MTLAVLSPSAHASFAPPPHRSFTEIGRELGITLVQIQRWDEFAAALEELQTRRLELEDSERGFAMDAPADVETIINIQVNWAQSRLDALTLLMQRTHALSEVLTPRQKQKANRLLQSLTHVT